MLIDRVQCWFLKRNQFWAVITVVAIAFIIVLQVSVTFLTGINSHIRQAIRPILIPLLLLFVLSIFWRNTVTTFLSLASAMCLYAGMYWTYVGTPQVVQNKYWAYLGVPYYVHTPPVDTIAELYFMIGLFSLMLCLGIAFRPSFFRAKGCQVGLPYPIWTRSLNNRRWDFSNSNSPLTLVPVQSL